MAKARIRICKLPNGLWRWELRTWGPLELSGMEYCHRWLAVRDMHRAKRLMAEAEIRED
jgi:hypothetical protein